MELLLPHISNIVMALIGAAAGVLAAWASMRKNKTDATSVLIESFQEELKRHATEIAELRAQVASLRAERDTAHDDLREQRDRVHEYQGKLRSTQEVLADYAEYVSDLDAWESGGSAPPKPTRSWRIREHMSSAALHTGPLAKVGEGGK